MSKTVVLVVDDDQNIRDTIVDILELEGYAAEAFSSAVGVVQRLEAGDISLVVTDLNMPDVDGIELIERIRATDAPRWANVPVILLTGAGFEERATEALERGATACFAKPFNIDDFIEAVTAAVGAPAAESGGQ